MKKMAELQLSVVSDPKNRKAIENQVQVIHSVSSRYSPSSWQTQFRELVLMPLAEIASVVSRFKYLNGRTSVIWEI